MDECGSDGAAGDAGVASLVEDPRRVPNGVPREGHVDEVIRELKRHTLMVDKLLTERVPLVGVRHGGVVGLLSLVEG